MKILLTPIGSHGDVHPFVGLGMELKRRGHRVVVIANPHYRKLVEQAGLEFVPLGSEEEFRDALANPEIWHPVEGFKLLMGFLLLPMRPLYQLIHERYEPGETVVVHPPSGLGARIAQEKLGFPLVTIHLAPSSLRSLEVPLALPGVWLPDWTPRFVKRMFFRYADQRLVAPLLEEPLNRFRAELGLAPVRRVLAGWWNSPDRILAFFPEWFAPMPSDWPAQTRHCGFPLFDESGMNELPDGLEAFLRAGEPPVIFTPGSAMRHGERFFRAAMEACGLLNRRGLLLTTFAEHVPANLPDTIKYFSYVPFSQVFPRGAAVVHHGGIGTTAQALAAGIPQLFMPMGFDQPDNAARSKRLGVGTMLSPHKFTGPKLAAQLQFLLRPEVRRRCQELAVRLTNRQTLARTCELIEEMPKSVAR